MGNSHLRPLERPMRNIRIPKEADITQDYYLLVNKPYCLLRIVCHHARNSMEANILAGDTKNKEEDESVPTEPTTHCNQFPTTNH